MATYPALDATSTTINFEANGAGTIGDPFRNKADISRIETPDTYQAVSGTVTTGTVAIVGPALVSDSIITIENPNSTGNLYIGAAASVGADITGVGAARTVIPPQQFRPFNLSNLNLLAIGSDNDGAEYAAYTTRFS